MNLTSYKGITFTTLGVTAPKYAGPESPGPERTPVTISRLDADPMVSGIEAGPQTMTFLFTPNGSTNYTEPTLAKVLAAVNPGDSTPGMLVGQFLKTGPSTFVTVEAEAVVGPWRYVGVNTLAIDFVVKGPWREQADTILKPDGPVSADFLQANLNTGLCDVHPKITVYWDGAQRASSVSTLGWKHRIGSGETITNTGVEPFIKQPYQIGPINHAAIVAAGQGLANGNDLRVFCEGRELRRNIIAANTAYCFLWVVLPTVAPKQAITLDILTNNPSAGSPPTLTVTSDPPLPAMSIAGEGFTATSSAAGSVTKTGAGWETNQWQGGTIIAPDGQMRLIPSNTATVISVANAWSPIPSGTGTYVITRSGLKGDGGLPLSAPTASTIEFDGGYDGEFVGGTVHILTGTGAGQTRTVTALLGGVATISPNWSTTPAISSTYRVYLRNGHRVWDVRTSKKATNHKGLWLTNTSERPPSLVNFDAPASWYRFTYQPSQDTYSQPRYQTYLIGGSDHDHFPVPYIQRARKGKRGGQKEVGIADAIGVSTPFPINNALFGYSMRNAKKAGSGSPGEGMCEAQFLCQEAGGTNWSVFWSDVTVYNSTTNVVYAGFDLTTFGSPNRVAWALIPNGSDDIPENDNNTALLTVSTTDQNLRLSVNPTAVMTTSVDWIAASPAVVAVYDVDLIARGGGVSATPPYHQIRIGGVDHRVFIAATGERIVVDCERHTATLTTDAGTFIRRIPYAIQANEIIEDTDGTNRTLVAARWLPVPPNAVDAEGIWFDDPSSAGWGTIGLVATGRLGYRV